jgi:two-component system, NarL family, response regulator LiaR
MCFGYLAQFGELNFMKNNAIRVFIVDDHKVVRKGLKAFLMAYDDLLLVGEAESGEEAIAQCEQQKPDVVLMDLVMPGMGGMAATRALSQSCPETRVIALTSFEEEDFVEEALKAGATSYLLKNVDADELAHAIRAAYRGRAVLAPEATQALIRATRRVPEPHYNLTDRERDVLALLVEGLTNPEIALRLAIKNSTVKFHLGNLFSKLGVTTRTEAVALALQHKLVGSP